MGIKEDVKAKSDAKNGGYRAAAEVEEDFSDLMHAAPEGSIEIGNSYLYRPGDREMPGTFTNELDGQGRKLAGPQAGKKHCGWLPIQGWLLEKVTRHSEQYKKDYDQFVFLLTKPGLGIDGENHRRCKIGDMIVVKAAGNMHEMGKAAEHSKLVTEFYLKPTGTFTEMKKEGQNPMRNWEKRPLQVMERKLLIVPRLVLPADDDDATFEPRLLGNQQSAASA